MSDCPRVGKLFGGCKFRPRYDTIGQTDPFIWMMTPQLQAQPAKTIYLCDVCETCGKTLFRRRDTERGPLPKDQR